MRTDHAPLQRQVHMHIQRLLQSGTVIAEHDGATHSIYPVAISAEVGEILQSWAVHERAAHTLEIGLGYALSALYLCEGLVQNNGGSFLHTVIDPFQSQRFANVGLQLLREAGLGAMIKHYAEPSHVVLPRLLHRGQQYDLAFVDGNHRFDSVFVDLYYLGRLVRKHGIIMLDDYDLPGIQRAVSFFVANLSWTIEQCGAEWVVLRTAATPDERHFTYFVDF